MKKSYTELTIHEKINLKHNFNLGEITIERYRLKTGERLFYMWKGIGAIIRLNKPNYLTKVKNINHPVDYQKTTYLKVA